MGDKLTVSQVTFGVESGHWLLDVNGSRIQEEQQEQERTQGYSKPTGKL
ncbi:hypothetical protein [Tsuneonella mangrovi]|nr:hypothetical protein [Tsuneonella mangrovi]